MLTTQERPMIAAIIFLITTTLIIFSVFTKSPSPPLPPLEQPAPTPPRFNIETHQLPNYRAIITITDKQKQIEYTIFTFQNSTAMIPLGAHPTSSQTGVLDSVQPELNPHQH